MLTVISKTCSVFRCFWYLSIQNLDPLCTWIKWLEKYKKYLIILFLSDSLLGQFTVSFLDDLLEVPPGVFQCLHGEPSVGVLANVEALDLLVKLGQGLKVDASGWKRSLEEKWKIFCLCKITGTPPIKTDQYPRRHIIYTTIMYEPSIGIVHEPSIGSGYRAEPSPRRRHWWNNNCVFFVSLPTFIWGNMKGWRQISRPKLVRSLS